MRKPSEILASKLDTLEKILFILSIAAEAAKFDDEADHRAVSWAVQNIRALMGKDILTSDNGLKAGYYHEAFRKAVDAYMLLDAMPKQDKEINISELNVRIVYTNACLIAKNLIPLAAVAFSTDFVDAPDYSNAPQEDRDTILKMRNFIVKSNIWGLLTAPPTIEIRNHGKMDTSFRPAPEILDATYFTTRENRTTTNTTTTAAASSPLAAESEAIEEREERPKTHKELYQENRKITGKLNGRYQPTKEDFLTLSNNLLHFASAGFLESSADTFDANEKSFLLRQYKWISENYKVYRKKIGKTQCHHLYNKTQLTNSLKSMLESDIPKVTSLVRASNKNGKQKEAVKKALKDLLHKYLNVKCTSCYLSLEKDFNIEQELNLIQAYLNQNIFRGMLLEMMGKLPANSLENIFYSGETESDPVEAIRKYRFPEKIKLPKKTTFEDAFILSPDGNSEEEVAAAATPATTTTAATATTTTTATAAGVGETSPGSTAPNDTSSKEEKGTVTTSTLPIKTLSSLLAKKPKKSFFSRNTEGKLQAYYETLTELLTNSAPAEERAEEGTIETVTHRLVAEFEQAYSDVNSELEKLTWSQDASPEIAKRIVNRLIFLKAAAIDTAKLNIYEEDKEAVQRIIINLSLGQANILTASASAKDKEEEVPNIFSSLLELIESWPKEALNCAMGLQEGGLISDKEKQALQSILKALKPKRDSKEGIFISEKRVYVTEFDKLVAGLNLKNAEALHQKLIEFSKAEDKEHFLSNIHKLIIYFLKPKEDAENYEKEYVKNFEIVLSEKNTTLHNFLDDAIKYVAKPLRTEIKKLPPQIARVAKEIFEKEITEHVEAIKEFIEVMQENEDSAETIKEPFKALYGDGSQTKPGLIKTLFQLAQDNGLDPSFIDDAIRFIQQSVVLEVSYPLGFGYDPQSSDGFSEGFLEGIMFTNDKMTAPISDEKIHECISSDWKLSSPHLATGAAAGKEEKTPDNTDKLQKDLKKLQEKAFEHVETIKAFLQGAAAERGNELNAEAIRTPLEALYGGEDDEGLIDRMETLASKLSIDDDKTLLNIIRFIQQTAVLEVSHPLGFGYNPESLEASPKGFESFMLVESESDLSPAKNNTLKLGLFQDEYQDWALRTKAERAAEQLDQENKAEEESPEQGAAVTEIEKLLTAFDQIEKTPEAKWTLENLEALKSERSKVEHIKGAIKTSRNNSNGVKLSSKDANRASEVTTYYNKLNLKVETLLEEQINGKNIGTAAAPLTDQGSPAMFATRNASDKKREQSVGMKEGEGGEHDLNL